MIKNSIEKIADLIGFDIGNSDNEVQAKLLNGLSKGLVNSMDKHKLQQQLCYIVNELDSNSHEVIKELAEFIKLKEQNK